MILNHSLVLLTILAIMLRMPQPAIAAPLDDALAKPTATGLLVAEVNTDGQGGVNGLLVGDIITTYGNIPITDLKSLRDARKAMAEQKTISVAITRGGAAMTITVNSESLGIKAVPVTKGIPAELLPASTGAMIDLSKATLPVDAWYTVEMNKQKAGYQHMMLTRDGDRFTLKTELAFTFTDEDKDVHHQRYITTVELESPANPKMLSTAHRFPPGNFTNDGKIDPVGADGKPAWVSKASWQEMEGEKPVTKTGQSSIPAPADLMADFGLEQLAAWMPTAVKSCCHLSVLNTGAGDLVDRAALVVTGPEDLIIAGKKVSTTRIDCHTIGDIPRTVWVDSQHQVVQADWLLYSTFAIHSTLTDRKSALVGVPESELPKP